VELPAGFRVVREPTPFERRIADAVRAIPPGRVASYSAVARVAGRPGAPRAVGAALARGLDVPAHRVVTASGRLVPGWEDEQRARLRAEGVRVRANAVLPPVPWWPASD
jgi:methylated-DNA-protein-cysteine methyltransferase related protein